MTTLKELLALMPTAFIPEKAAGIDAVIQFKFTGEEAGDHVLTIKDGKCEVKPGSVPAPRLTISADSADIIKLFTGQLDGMQAFMQGKLRIAGDMSLATRLVGLFKL